MYYGRVTTCSYQFYCISFPLLAQYAMARKKRIACTILSHNALLEFHCFDATFASLPFHSVMQCGLETVHIVKERLEIFYKIVEFFVLLLKTMNQPKVFDKFQFLLSFFIRPHFYCAIFPVSPFALNSNSFDFESVALSQ